MLYCLAFLFLARFFTILFLPPKSAVLAAESFIIFFHYN